MTAIALIIASLPTMLLAYLGWRAAKHPHHEPDYTPHHHRLAGCPSDYQTRQQFAAQRRQK
jgi:hypothetical protein